MPKFGIVLWTPVGLDLSCSYFHQVESIDFAATCLEFELVVW